MKAGNFLFGLLALCVVYFASAELKYARRPEAKTPVDKPCSELNLGPKISYIDCDDGTCLVEPSRLSFKCDGIMDCRTGKDEDVTFFRADEDCQYNMRQQCRSLPRGNTFVCGNKSCINKKFVGDGFWDCYDKSDEPNNINST